MKLIFLMMAIVSFAYADEKFDEEPPEFIRQFVLNDQQYDDENTQKFTIIVKQGFRADEDFKIFEDETLFLADYKDGVNRYHVLFTVTPKILVGNTSKEAAIREIKGLSIVQYKVLLNGTILMKKLKSHYKDGTLYKEKNPRPAKRVINGKEVTEEEMKLFLKKKRSIKLNQAPAAK